MIEELIKRILIIVIIILIIVGLFVAGDSLYRHRTLVIRCTNAGYNNYTFIGDDYFCVRTVKEYFPVQELDDFWSEDGTDTR